MKPVTIDVQHEAKIVDWLKHRGGIAVWVNHDLGSDAIGTEVQTPALHESGQPMGSPHWRYTDKPDRIITDPALVFMRSWEVKEVMRCRPGNGPHGMRKDDYKKLQRRLELHGPEAQYEFTDELDLNIVVPKEVRPINMEMTHAGAIEVQNTRGA